MASPSDAAAATTDAGEADTDEAARCRYCGRRFPTDRLRSLHHGSAHTDVVSDAEWEAVLAAREAEAADLRRLRIRMLIGLVACYFGLLFLYAAV